MTVASAAKMTARSIASGLAIALLCAAGCEPGGMDVPTSAPKSPLPTAGGSRPPAPEPSRGDQGGETNRVGSARRDLSKDQAESSTDKGGPTTFNPPAGKPQDIKPDDATKSGQP